MSSAERDMGKHWWDRLKPFLEIGGVILQAWLVFITTLAFLAAAIYACIALKQLKTSQRTFDLYRQQLVGTMSAVVTFQEPSMTPDPITGKEMLLILFSNQGHVISPNFHGNMQVEIVSFPSLTTPFNSQTYGINVPQLGLSGWSQRYPLQDFGSQELQSLTQKKTVTVKGRFGFDNGFGDKFEQDFCYSYIGRYNIKNDEGGSTSGGGGFLPCQVFPEQVSYILSRQF